MGKERQRVPHCEQNEMWSEKQPSLVSLSSICSRVKNLQHTISSARSAGKASRWHCSTLHTELVCKQALTRAHLERHGRRISKSLSVLRQPLLYQHKGIASVLLWGSEFCFSFHSSTGCCCQPSVQVYFSFRCEEGDKVSIYWIWGTSCWHNCSAKWLHVQGNPSASGWDLQPFVLFSLGLYYFLQWSEDGKQQLNNCSPVLAQSKSSDSLHFFLLLHFAFTDELLSFVINLKTWATLGSLNFNNLLKCRFPRDWCIRKIFLVCLSWAWLLKFPYLSAVLIPANSLRIR